ncbi:hypothetical protein ATI61_105696 [Archangium gephyra]|uniref:Uncharacterized protein n=1 Tax=Archangium gephyra TaxID=48 RepID=A0ABX9K3I2_9BACT|nr:hypothetical protein ATI61_105696 [Archangium gephyra]
MRVSSSGAIPMPLSWMEIPQAGEEEANEAPQAAVSKEPMKERPSGVDWADLVP